MSLWPRGERLLIFELMSDGRFGQNVRLFPEIAERA